MKTKGQFLGHCQACGAQQVVLSGVDGLAKHGYRVAGFGFFNGVCQGSGEQPLEHSRKFLDRIVEQLKVYAKTSDATAVELRSGKIHPATVYKRTEFGNLVYDHMSPKPSTVFWVHANELEQTKGRELAISGAESDAKQARSHAKGLLELATRVHGKALQPRHLTDRPGPQVGDTVHLYGKGGFDVVVTAVEDHLCRGVGPHMNGRRLPHIVYERNGKTGIYPVQLIRRAKNVDNSEKKQTIPSDDRLTTTNSKQEKIMASKKAKGKAKAKKTNGATKGPSLVSQAVAFMTTEVKKAGGLKKLEHGVRKTIVEAAAKKFGLAVPTCATQYQKQVRAA